MSLAAVEISNELAVSVLGVTAERDGWGQLDVAVVDTHTAESFPDRLASREQRHATQPRAKPDFVWLDVRHVNAIALRSGLEPFRREVGEHAFVWRQD